MKTMIRKGALTLALISGAALMTAPAMANSIHKEGQFGGSWSKIEPSSGYYQQRRHAGRVGPLYSGHYYRGYYGPRYSYYSPRYSYYSPRYSYYRPYSAPYYRRGSGVSFGFSFY